MEETAFGRITHTCPHTGDGESSLDALLPQQLDRVLQLKKLGILEETKGDLASRHEEELQVPLSQS